MVCCIAISPALASFTLASGSRICKNLVRSKIKYRIITIKNLLRTVAVVYIKIDYQNFIIPFVLSISCTDCDIVKKAKTHRLVGFSMMSRRSYGSKCHIKFTVFKLIYRNNCRSCSGKCRFV